VYLKDRFKETADKDKQEKEKLWYDRAFGALRNMMKIELSFTPPGDQVPAGKFIFLVKIKYTMYPEMVEEFGDDKYPATAMHVMEVDSDETNPEYFLELDRPYGSYELEIFFKEGMDKEG